MSCGATSAASSTGTEAMPLSSNSTSAPSMKGASAGSQLPAVKSQVLAAASPCQIMRGTVPEPATSSVTAVAPIAKLTLG
ncbi:MAG: hypothetical protein BWX70_03117 [Verrucomicrobia bacterium ADurb.Bin070]|nr:MAG: hypothetical protein BWX70_03117 [Verrucomicrobia bacterium ADurb.Bin070]